MDDRSIDRALALLDRLAPRTESGSRSREELNRARTTVAAALIGCALLTTTAVSSALMGLDAGLAAVNFAWALALLLVLLIARRFASVSLLANAVIGVAFAHTFLLSALAGGRNIGALFSFAVFPLLAVLLTGWRSGLVFTALSTAAVLLTPLVPLDLLTPDHLAETAFEPVLVRDALNVTLAVGLVAVLYDAVRGSTLRDELRARRDAEASSDRALEAADRQRQLVELSRRLQDAPAERFDEEIQRAMELAADLAGADRTVLQLFENGEVAGRFTWGEDWPTSRARTTLEETYRGFEWSVRRIWEGETIQVRRLEDLPPEAAAERRYYERRGVVSWLTIPIRAGATELGYQRFETTTREAVWDEETTHALRLLTEIVASAVRRHRTEIALRESEAKFWIAFRDHPDAMLITDLETDEILECNEQWLKEAGRSKREQVMGHRPWDFEFEVPQEHRDAIRRVIQDSGRMSAIEIPVRSRSGDTRTYLVSATRVEISGRPCALANIHDLTERKRLEQQLLHSQKMEAVGRLAGGVAHDYNNMLTVISGYGESLRDHLDGELAKDAEEILRAARRSAELTRQLLGFSRRQILQTEVIAPNDLIADIETLLRPLIGESIRLRLDLESGVDGVQCDRGQLEQAIVNLVVNARDAMPDGGPITLRTRVREHRASGGTAGRRIDLEPGRYVVMSVLDEGSGFDAELAERVVEPFFTTKAEGKGTGLGLPMVHGLAQQCGGTLVLESEPGVGTSAHIHLPAVEHAAARRSQEARPADRPIERRAHRVLLVEDEATVRRLASRTLRHAGYEVDEVENGERALERVQELGESLDVVVSDVVMPQMSGPELIRELRRASGALPVVLMSGYADPTDGPPVPDDVVFLLKPFEPSRLCEAVERALRSKPDRPEIGSRG